MYLPWVVGIAVIHGEQKTNEDEQADGRNSPPLVEHSRIMDVGVGVPALAAKEKPPINVVGDVGGRIAIMVVCWLQSFFSLSLWIAGNGFGIILINSCIRNGKIPFHIYNLIVRWYVFDCTLQRLFTLLQDDMIDDVASFVAAAEVLKDRGAYKIYVMATHGLLSSDAPRLIDDSPIDEVWGQGYAKPLYLVLYSSWV